jgi:hypothetical protein
MEMSVPGRSPAEIYEHYRHFGDDPFILGPDTGSRFSAWDYAKQICQSIDPKVN